MSRQGNQTSSRADRLAEQLRANLRKRKSQDRGRRLDDPPQPSAEHSDKEITDKDGHGHSS